MVPSPFANFNACFITKKDIMTNSELPLKSKPKCFNLNLKICTTSFFSS